MSNLNVETPDAKASESARNEAVLFDEYAGDYEAALQRGSSVMGESKNYFAERRILWLSQRLKEIGEKPETLMDFGCGTGTVVPFLFDYLKVERIVGIDVSTAALAIARRTQSSERTRFATLHDYTPAEDFDMVFCNGVFHHIAVAERQEAMEYVLRSLKPGGVFAFCENNPWNLGTRYVMSKIPYDRNALTLAPSDAQALLRKTGFQILHTDYLFVFPKALAFLRGLEPALSHLPLGAQYMMLCRKPTA